ncbi:hypothetical protein C7M84_014164 [Penaeus vannamei]|uniref:C2 domain-containing protein n=1 Tax=Penaeus vannamei TaxID=6689 RepID=A0A3R7NVD2_PENVA|nr:hypothetical protein C7M84_014164 [Penaeus vannamei]
MALSSLPGAPPKPALPDGVPAERQRAKFIVRVYRADGLPKINSSIMANVKKAFTGDSKDLIDPYVQVSFAGLSGRTSVKKNTASPTWNEQIVFTEMFPPLCQRVKIQLRDNDAVNDTVIGTHFLDLTTISNEGQGPGNPSWASRPCGTRRPRHEAHDQRQDLLLPALLGRQACLYIRSFFQDHAGDSTTRTHRGNTTPAEEGLSEVSGLMEEEDGSAERRLKEVLEELVSGCGQYLSIARASSAASTGGRTKLDKERMRLCQREIDHLGSAARHTKALVTRHSLRDRYKTAHGYLTKLRGLVEDPQHSLPDVFLWMISGGKRVAYQRIPTRHLIYSPVDLERGKSCGVTQTLFLKLPGRKSSGPGGWAIQAKLQIYLWLGMMKHKKHFLPGIPKGYETPYELRNIERTMTLPPITLHYTQKQIFQLRAHMYQARSLIASDNSGLSDPFARVIIGEHCRETQVIDETLSPTWTRCWSSRRHPRVRDQGGDESSASAHRHAKNVTQKSITKWSYVINLRNAFFLLSHSAPFVPSCTYPLPPTSPSPSPHLRPFLILTHLSSPHPCPPASPPLLSCLPPDHPASLFPLHPNLPYQPHHQPFLFLSSALLRSNPSPFLPPSPPPLLSFLLLPHPTPPFLPHPPLPPSSLLTSTSSLLLPPLPPHSHLPPSPPSPVPSPPPRANRSSSGEPWHDPTSSYGRSPTNDPTSNGTTSSGGRTRELLATFELLQFQDGEEGGDVIAVPQAKEYHGGDSGPLMPVPRGIRPTLAKYRLEVLFWGLRDLKRIHLLTVDRPRVDVEVAGHIIQSAVITSARRNPNFTNPVKYIDLELPEQELYCPPITIRVVDCRSFGRFTLVGTHIISNLHRYTWTPTTKREKEAAARNASLVQLQDDPNGVGNNNALVPNNVHGGGGGSAAYRGNHERSPLLQKDTIITIDYQQQESRGARERADNPDGEQTQQQEAQREAAADKKKHHTFKASSTAAKLAARLSPKTQRRKPKQNIALMKVIPGDLETEFNGFREWLHTFELYRGKKTGDELEDENRVVGKFKGSLKLYRWPLPKDIDDTTITGGDPQYGFFQGLPSNDPIHVLVRVYVVRACDLHPMDLNGKADPYILIYLGGKKVSDKENYISKQLNPVFGKSGYNQWRDPMKPTQILARFCKEGRLDGPHYGPGKVRIGPKTFTLQNDDEHDPGRFRMLASEEQLALAVLHRWEEVPKVGCRLVPEHIETRPLYNPDKPGIEQGKIEMWVDMFPMDMPLPGPPLDVTPRKPKSYELRVIIWNTDDVVLEDDAFFTGEKMARGHPVHRHPLPVVDGRRELQLEVRVPVRVPGRRGEDRDQPEGVTLLVG